jgi:hypothetical protein
MKKPILIHIFYSHPYLDTKHPTYIEFEIKTKLLIENVPHVGDSFNMLGLFSKIEISKARKEEEFLYDVPDLVLVKDRIIKYENFEIDSIGLSVTEHPTSAFGEE